MKTMIKTVFAGLAAAWTMVAPCVDLSAGQVVFGTGNVARDCCALSDIAQQNELLVLMKDRCPNPICAVAGLVDEIACYGVGASSLELSADETDASVQYRVRAGAEVSFGIDVMKENGLVYLHLPGTIDIGSFLAHGM